MKKLEIIAKDGSGVLSKIDNPLQLIDPNSDRKQTQTFAQDAVIPGGAFTTYAVFQAGIRTKASLATASSAAQAPLGLWGRAVLTLAGWWKGTKTQEAGSSIPTASGLPKAEANYTDLEGKSIQGVEFNEHILKDKEYIVYFASWCRHCHTLIQGLIQKLSIY